METAREKLKSVGVSVTQPRVEILDFLMTHHIHPTVDTIYNELLKTDPGLSRTTVYNTVQLLTRHGLLTSLNIDDTHVNLDGNTTPHAHLLCRVCGKIVDLPLTGISAEQASGTFGMEGNMVEEVHQYYKGVCKDCIKKEL